jgi:hypothetical protein
VADAEKTADESAEPSGSTTADESADETADGSAGDTKRAKAPAKEKQEKEKKPKKERNTAKKVVAGANAVRSRIASVVWLVAVLCAVFLAVGALLFALKMNPGNAIVSFVYHVDRLIDLGTFKRFTGKNHLIKGHLVNWGLAAVIYLVVGKILDRLIRP